MATLSGDFFVGFGLAVGRTVGIPVGPGEDVGTEDGIWG